MIEYIYINSVYYQIYVIYQQATSRRALGKTKKCQCTKAYTCCHNKTASYNTRKPIYTVVLYRRNAKRLKRAGRAVEVSYYIECFYLHRLYISNTGSNIKNCIYVYKFIFG